MNLTNTNMTELRDLIKPDHLKFISSTFGIEYEHIEKEREKEKEGEREAEKEERVESEERE